MSRRLVLFGILGWIGAVQAEQLSRVPFAPGAYLVDGKTEGFCRNGPGGKSLIVETADSIAVITVDGAKAHVDRFADDGVLRLDGGFEGTALVVSGGGQKLAMERENDAAVVRVGEKPPQRWTRASAAASGVATGIGGVFFKAKDAKKLRGWYAQHLGLVPSQYGFVDLRWRDLTEPSRVAHTIWATFKPESTHFDGPFMIDYRVDRLDLLLEKLEKDGVKIERKEDDPGGGHFAWIRDGEGNLVELWQPTPGG
ncbi:MAG TPA: VOC family protein [Myxococcales bacterium]|nr:VOC family protein [Myxococcales bacterium]